MHWEYVEESVRKIDLQLKQQKEIGGITGFTALVEEA
jgi:hypothetical protein